MTLVICRLSKNKKNVFIHSDSRITQEYSNGLVRDLRQNKPLCGMLKTLIIHRFVCVSFAGNIEFAEVAINRAITQNEWNFGQFLEMLVGVHLDSEEATDFIVASVFDQKPRIDRIANGCVEEALETAWIGDKDAFECYQEHFHNTENTGSLKQRMSAAFGKVIEDTSVTSVGDFHISTQIDHEIESDSAVFTHDLKFEVVVPEPQTISFDYKGQAKPLKLGSVEGGSSGVSYLRTVSPAHHGVAIHFTHGGFGVLFCPQISVEEGILVEKVSGREFVEYIAKTYHIPLQGFIRHGATAMQLIDTRDLVTKFE